MAIVAHPSAPPHPHRIDGLVKFATGPPRSTRATAAQKPPVRPYKHSQRPGSRRRRRDWFARLTHSACVLRLCVCVRAASVCTQKRSPSKTPAAHTPALLVLVLVCACALALKFYYFFTIGFMAHFVYDATACAHSGFRGVRVCV